MNDEEIIDKKDNINFQYPKKSIKKESFIVVLVGDNFLILNDDKDNNIRVKCSSPTIYSVGEKIYKENGNFSWEKA